MLRAPLLFALFAVCLFASIDVASAVVAGSVDNPNTPSDGDSSAEAQCLLSSLTFTNGLKLTTTFSPTTFHYNCSTEDMSDPYQTQVIPWMEDPGSSAEITFNGEKINFRTMDNAISDEGDNGLAPNSPRRNSSVLTFVVGTNFLTVGVGCNGGGEPVTCYYQYNITCERPSTIVGDPQFVGLRGQSYQVHGVAGEVYNIVSDSDLQYNSRFVFLESGECPVVNGKKQKGCFSHPGSYLGELGLKTRAGDRIQLVSGSAKSGFASVSVNNKELSVGESVLLADDLGSVSRNSTHLTSVQVGNWDFGFENSDMYVNQKVRVRDRRNLRSHGLLGQTWRETVYPNAVKYVQGQVDDYVIRDADLFGDNFVYNTFN